ncbi:MAG: hypothetical protein WCB71_03640 [Aestuariivirga sp.]
MQTLHHFTNIKPADPEMDGGFCVLGALIDLNHFAEKLAGLIFRLRQFPREEADHVS